MPNHMMTNENVSLSRGSLNMILNGAKLDAIVLQILDYERVPGAGVERFRLLLNDGTMLFSFAILATQLNCLIKDKKLEKFSIMKLNNYVCTEAQPGKKIILCREVTPLIPGNTINHQIKYVPLQKVNNFGVSRTSSSVSNIEKSAFKCYNMNDNNKDQSTYDSTSILNAPSTSKMISTVPKPLFRKVCEFITIKKKKLPLENNKDRIEKKRNVQPISSLTPYQNTWTIKVRVIYKTHIINYSNDKKSGKFVSFVLLDDSKQIRGTAHEELAERLYKFIQLNKVYYISKAIVDISKISSSNLQLKLLRKTGFEEFKGDISGFPKLIMNFIPFNQINNANNLFVDVIGVCYSTTERTTMVNRVTNKEISKLEIRLIDADESKITVTLWGSDAENFKASDFPVIAIKNVKVTDFKGFSLTAVLSSMIFVNPDYEETHLLRSWFETYKSNLHCDSDNSYKTNKIYRHLSHINNLELDEFVKKDYSIVKATIIMVQKENAMYQACPSTDCFQKVSVTPNGCFHCSKCNQDYNSYCWTLLLNINIADFTSDLWVLALRKTAESILQMETEELSSLKNTNEEKFISAISSVHFKSFIFKLCSKKITFNERTKLSSAVLEVKPIDSIDYTKKMLFEIRRMEKILRSQNQI